MEVEKSDILNVIGSNIKRARLLRGLTQEALSERLDTSTNFISLVERGSSGISLTNLVDICKILEVDTSFIFDGLVTSAGNNDNLVNTISLLQGEDRVIVDNLVNYIINSKK